MGAGGLARYLNAWMDADEQEKSQLLQLMKDAANVTNVTTQTKGLRQQIDLRESNERRVQELFPIEKGQAQADLGLTETDLAGARRKEAGAADAEEDVRKEFGRGPQTLELLDKILTIFQNSETTREMTAQGFSKESAGQQVSAARAGAATADLQRETSEAASDVQLPLTGAQLARSEDVLATGVAREGQRKTEIRRRLGATGKEAVAEVATAEAATAQAGATTSGAAIAQAQNEALQRLPDFDETLAQAALDRPGLENDVLRAEIQKLNTATKGTMSDLEQLQSIEGSEKGARMWIDAYKVKNGLVTEAATYLGNIESTLAQIADIQTKLSQGETVDLMTAIVLKSANTELKDIMLDKNKNPNAMTPAEILKDLHDYVRVQKTLLRKEHGISYKGELLEGLSADVSDERTLTDVIRRIEAAQVNPLTPSPIQRSAQLYGSGPIPANRQSVISSVLRIVNDKDLTADVWQDSIIENREAFLTPVSQRAPGQTSYGFGWTEQDYFAALGLIRSLVNFKLHPESLPLPVTTDRGEE